MIGHLKGFIVEEWVLDSGWKLLGAMTHWGSRESGTGDLVNNADTHDSFSSGEGASFCSKVH